MHYLLISNHGRYLFIERSSRKATSLKEHIMRKDKWLLHYILEVCTRPGYCDYLLSSIPVLERSVWLLRASVQWMKYIYVIQTETTRGSIWPEWIHVKTGQPFPDPIQWLDQQENKSRSELFRFKISRALCDWTLLNTSGEIFSRVPTELKTSKCVARPVLK